MKSSPTIVFLIALALSMPLAAGRTAARPLDAQTARTLTGLPPKVNNRQMRLLDEGPRRGVSLDAHEGDGVAWWPDVLLANGTIDLDLRGKDVLQQSFVGVAFHGVDGTTFDAIYFRPFNFKPDDATRRAHAVQYVSHPTYTWDKLRADHPGQYENAVAPAPDPNGWFHARVVLAFPSVQVFVGDLKAPVLAVTQISDRKTGWVGLWVGNGSDGSFANLTITPAAK